VTSYLAYINFSNLNTLESSDNAAISISNNYVLVHIHLPIIMAVAKLPNITQS